MKIVCIINLDKLRKPVYHIIQYKNWSVLQKLICQIIPSFFIGALACWFLMTGITMLNYSYNMAHGNYNTAEGISSRNREGILPALFEAYRIPYIGTDAFGLSLTLNKYLTKIIAQHYGIKTPESILVSYPGIDNNIGEELEKLHFQDMLVTI